MIFDLGILFFAAVVLFHTVTLPVELNASKRAIRQLVDLRIIEPAETAGAKKGAVRSSNDICCGTGDCSGESDPYFND